MMEVRKPEIFTDGGPWAEHDQACAICHQRKAVLILNTYVFQPCWTCQSQGYEIRRKKFWFKPDWAMRYWAEKQKEKA